MVDAHGRFVWYELMTTDLVAAKAFYAKILGWGTRDAALPGSAYSLFTMDDTPVAGLIELPADASRAGALPHWMGHIGVDDVDSCVERVKQFGGFVRVPPRDIPNISRFSIVADPQMASFALVKGRKPAEAQASELSKSGCVGWHELLAADWEKAFAFYSVLFGWQRADSHFGAMGTYQQFSAGGEAIGGMFTKPVTLPFAFWLYYFNVRDLDFAVEQIQSSGGQILYGPIVVPGSVRILHASDPLGAVFALLDRRKPIGYFKPAPRKL